MPRKSNDVTMFPMQPMRIYSGGWIYLMLCVLILTEIIDDLLDHLLGSSIIHSLIQLLVFIMLFFILARLFLLFYKSKINKLLPEELMGILKQIKASELKGMLINQVGIRKNLNITKPTLKKRIETLIDLQYVVSEEKGNHKYIRLTPLGNSIVK